MRRFRIWSLLVSAASLATAPSARAAEMSVGWVQPTSGVSIGVDGDDNVYTVNYDAALGGDITLTKRTAQGELVWAVNPDHAQSPFWEQATWVATDPDGNIFVSGTMKSGFSNPVNAASAITKFSPSGAVLWRHVYESDFDGSSTRKCIVDDAGSVYIFGLGIGEAGLVSTVKKFSSRGEPLWSYFDQAGIGAPINIKFTPDNHIVLVGRGIVGSINGYAKVTLEGEEVWSLGGVQSLTVGDCAGDAAGNTYVVHGEYVANGGTVIRKLDPSGNQLWSRTFALSAFRIEVGGDQQAVACGFPNPNAPGAAFIKVDGEGELVWANLDADGPGLGLLLHAQLLLDAQDNAYLAAGTLFQMAVCRVNADGSSAWTALMPGSYANAMRLSQDQSSLFLVGGGATARIDGLLDAPAADLNGDGAVDGADLGPLLGAWGSPDDAADLNGDGAVDGADLGLLLGAWTS